MSSERTLTAEQVNAAYETVAHELGGHDEALVSLRDSHEQLRAQLAACEQERDEARLERDDFEIEVQSLLKKIGVLSDRMWAAEAALAKLQALRPRIEAAINRDFNAPRNQPRSVLRDVLSLFPVDARQERR